MKKEHDPEEVYVGILRVRNGYLVQHGGLRYVYDSFSKAVEKVGELLHKDGKKKSEEVF